MKYVLQSVIGCAVVAAAIGLVVVFVYWPIWLFGDGLTANVLIGAELVGVVIAAGAGLAWLHDN